MKEPIWIEEREVLILHNRLLTLHGGAGDVRDDTLLKSALGRPRQHFAYDDKPDIRDLAALYTVSIVRNHPFVDGNKRTGFVTGILFLELNGYRFESSEVDAARTVLGLAAGKIDEREYAEFIRENSVGED